MENVKISVCIPCYNCEHYLDDVFNSLSNQTFKDFNVVFVDDGSTDNTLSKLNDFKQSKRIPNDIKIIHQPNKGLAETRNVLIKNSTGEYIFFLDADDILPKKSLQALYANSDNGQRDIVVGRANVVFKRKYRFPFLVQYRYTKTITSAHYVKSNICLAWGSLLKREIFNNNEFLKGYSYEDIGLMNYVFLKYNNFKAIKDVVYLYERHSDTLSSFTKNRKWNIIDIYHQVDHAFKKYDKEGWLNNKEYKRYINGTLFQIYVAVYWLAKHYTTNRILNNMPLYAITKLITEFEIGLKFSKTFWKTLSYFYVRGIYRSNYKNICIPTHAKFQKLKFFKDLSNIKNKKNHIYLINDIESNINIINKYKKVCFFSLEDNSQLLNVYKGIKPSSITEKILEDEKIFFIDLSSFQKLSNKEIDIIRKINPRIIIFLHPNHHELASDYMNIVILNGE